MSLLTLRLSQAKQLKYFNDGSYIFSFSDCDDTKKFYIHMFSGKKLQVAGISYEALYS